MSPQLGFVVVLIFVALTVHTSSGVSVLGIDIGGEWFKLALVTAGAYDIVLNEQSGRRTPNLLAFYQNERFFGNEAKPLFTRTPRTTIANANALLGRRQGDKLVESLVADGALLSDLAVDPHDATAYVFKTSSTNASATISPVEAAAMVLRYAKSLAAASAGAPVKDCCITVPPYYSAAERLALLDAARLAGFTPLALINAGTAAAVNHVTKGKLEDKPRYLLVYDIGAVDTSASLFEIKQVNETRGKFVKKNVTVGVLETIGVGWDETLGGRAFDIALARLFVAAIKKQRPDIDVFANDARAWARLVKEAARVKEVLSANTMFDARVEGLVTDYDFKLRVTREDFERACAPLLARVGKPILDAVAQAGINIKDIGGAEVVGGGWRVPAVQERLKTVLGRDTIDQHINGDEGAVMGAAFFGASLAPGFRVKDFKVKDAVFSPIDVKIVSQPLAEGAAPMAGDDEPLDKATELWKAASRLRSKKTLTFATARNMTLALSYGAGSVLSGSQSSEIGTWSITGVPNPQTHANLTAVPKVTATLMLDASGIVRLVKAEAQIEVEHWVMPKAAKKPRVAAAAAAAAANETAEAAAANKTASADENAAKSDEEADENDEAAEDEQPKVPETPKTPGFGAVKAIDAGSALIAHTARKDLEAWLGAPLEHFTPIQYATYVDVDGELGYFFKVRTTNVPIVEPDEPAAEAEAEVEAPATPDPEAASEEVDEAAVKKAAEDAKKAAEAIKRTKELERLLRKLAADTNEYLHVRVNYDPSGKSATATASAADATIGEADEEGVARVNDAPTLNVQVRGVSEKKAAIDVLEYFDENIVPKAQVLKRSLTVALNVTQVSGVRSVADAVFSEATASLAAYDLRDVEKRARADAKNAVESYCYDMKEKLEDEALASVTLESERDEFRALLSDASDWLDIEGASATTKAFQDKLASLRKLGDEFAQRLREIVEAPKLAEEMRALVDGAKEILANITSTHSVTQEEASGALTVASEALEWLEKTEKEQSALKAHEKRALTVATIQEAFGKFERRLKSLLKRPKKSKKKATTAKKASKKDAEKDKKADEKADADADADAE